MTTILRYCGDSPNPEKARQSQELRVQIDEFLARGGKIEKVEIQERDGTITKAFTISHSKPVEGT